MAFPRPFGDTKENLKRLISKHITEKISNLSMEIFSNQAHLIWQKNLLFRKDALVMIECTYPFSTRGWALRN